MATALISSRRLKGGEARDAEAEAAAKAGCTVDFRLDGGCIVSGAERAIAALAGGELRVRRLEGLNLLSVGGYSLDIEKGDPHLPPALTVPRKAATTWMHHLVQLRGLPNIEWIRQIERAGDVVVVERIPRYGLFVHGKPGEVRKLSRLPFVAWVGPFQPAYRIGPSLRGRQGWIEYVGVRVYPPDQLAPLRRHIESSLYGKIQRETQARDGRKDSATLVVELHADHLEALARHPFVRSLEYVSLRVAYNDERTCQIAAGNIGGAIPPVAPGYAQWLADVGLSGAGAVVAICDSGVNVNADNNDLTHTDAHPDLVGRQAGFQSYTSESVDELGHGTHVAGIAVANAATGITESGSPGDFLFGQGIAPQARYVTQALGSVASEPIPPVQTIGEDAVAFGAEVVNCSWEYLNSQGNYYDQNSLDWDATVREAGAASGSPPLAAVFAAGNYGNSLHGSPKEAKNVITVGNSLTFRPAYPIASQAGDVNAVYGSSSIGPTGDGRVFPTVLAPGALVVSTIPQVNALIGSYDGYPVAGAGGYYKLAIGTSQAAPHVTGLCALLVEWWRNRTGIAPSPAMLKALLVNGADDLAITERWLTYDYFVGVNGMGPVFYFNLAAGVIPTRFLLQGFVVFGSVTNPPDSFYMEELTEVASLAAVGAGNWYFDAATSRLHFQKPAFVATSVGITFAQIRTAHGTPHIPNALQGWGRVNLKNIIQRYPATMRGYKMVLDQTVALTTDGEEFAQRVMPVDGTVPLRVTLVWTDPPGTAGTGDSPASPVLVNQLNLEVTEEASGTTYLGNDFANGFSTTGGSPDTVNNVECVYIQNPSGAYTIRVVAASLQGNAQPPFDMTPWQDFALVIDNAEPESVDPIAVVPVIDRSSSMISYGYVDVTLIAAKQFVDSLELADEVGLVSFSTTFLQEWPDPAVSTAIGTVNDETDRAAIKTAVDAVNFGGLTYMAGGILEAKRLLDGASLPRKGIVLFSDGFDNRARVATNPYARAAVTAIVNSPTDSIDPIHACAMGPNSDQTLLQDLATLTGGEYYYMPEIEDLFAISNFIRGTLSFDGVIVNESAWASQSRVEAFVDAAATRVDFQVAWPDLNVQYTDGRLESPSQVAVRLRDPGNRLVHPMSSRLHTLAGPGYVNFRIENPVPGRWYVEVETYGDTHLQYTVGGFVRSEIGIDVTVSTKEQGLKYPVHVAVQAFDGLRPFAGYTGNILLTQPSYGLSRLAAKYGPVLQQLNQDGKDAAANELLAYLRKLRSKRPDLFGHDQSKIALKHGGDYRRPYPLDKTRLHTLRSPGFLAKAIRRKFLWGTFTPPWAGSYNAVVTVAGTAPYSRSYFVRKQLVSLHL